MPDEDGKPSLCMPCSSELKPVLLTKSINRLSDVKAFKKMIVAVRYIILSGVSAVTR